MADNEKLTFPTIPVKQWWVLRKKFSQTIPSSVTPSYLATTLEMKEQSARANILPSLVSFGLVDEEGKPQPRAKQWRDDAEYPQLCAQILQEIYPAELLEALPPPNPDRTAAESWFARKTGVGQAAAKKMAAVYELLAKADPSEGQDQGTSPRTSKKSSPRRRSPKSTPSGEATPEATPQPVVDASPSQQPIVRNMPSLHFDIQIHIAPDASLEQIDRIFESMAKHLSKLTNASDE